MWKYKMFYYSIIWSKSVNSTSSYIIRQTKFAQNVYNLKLTQGAKQAIRQRLVAPMVKIQAFNYNKWRSFRRKINTFLNLHCTTKTFKTIKKDNQVKGSFT